MTPSIVLLSAASGGLAQVAMAVTDNTGVDPFNLIPTVTPAVVVGLLVAGVLRTRGEVNRLEAENVQLRTVLLDQAVPALARSADVQEETRTLLEEIKPLLVSVREVMRTPGRR